MSCAQTELVFDGEGGFVTAVLRPAKRPSGKEIKALLRRLLGAIRAHWPNTEILARGPTATIAVPRFSIGVAPMASITSSASRQPRHCAAMSKISKPARRRDSRPRREMASFVVSWSSSNGAQSWSVSGRYTKARRARLGLVIPESAWF